MNRGQSLVELAVCAPIVTLLAIGAVSLVQVAESKQGLDAATQAAVAAAARAPDAATARSAARERFTSAVAGYALHRRALRLSLGDFGRGGLVAADSSATVDVEWGGLFGIPGRITLTSSAESRVEDWRSRAPAP